MNIPAPSRTGLPYIEPAFGKRALPMDRERNRQDAIDYITRGRRFIPGPGMHRSSLYAHFRYNVTEDAA